MTFILCKYSLLHIVKLQCLLMDDVTLRFFIDINTSLTTKFVRNYFDSGSTLLPTCSMLLKSRHEQSADKKVDRSIYYFLCDSLCYYNKEKRHLFCDTLQYIFVIATYMSLAKLIDEIDA